MYEKIPDMLSQIFTVGEESIVSSAERKKEREDKEARLSQISSWLWTRAGIETFKELIAIIQYFQSEEGRKELLQAQKEMAARQMPVNELSAKLTQKMGLAQLFLNFIKEAKVSLEEGNLEKATGQFKEFSELLMTLKPNELPSYLQTKLNQSLDSFLLQGPRGKTAGDLLFLMGLASKAIAFKKEKLTGDALQEKIESTVEGLAMNIPSSPFIANAASLLSQPNFPDFIKKMATAPEEELEKLTGEFKALLADVQDKAEVKISLAASQKSLSQELKSDHQYDAYLKIFEEDENNKQLEEMVKNLNLNSLKELSLSFNLLAKIDPSIAEDLVQLSDLYDKKLPTGLKELSTLRITLTSLFKKLTKLSKRGDIPFDVRKEFLDKLNRLFDENLRIIEENELACQQHVTDFETKSEEISDARALVSQFTQTLTKAEEKGSLSFPEIQENIQTLFDLIGNFRIQSSDAKEHFVSLFDSLSTATSQGKKFSTLIASATTALWLREFSRSQPGGSIDNFKKFMDGKLASLKQVAPSHPFLEDLYHQFNGIKEDPAFPMTASAFGPTYMKEEEELIAPNPLLPKAVESSYIPASTHIKAIKESSDSTQNKLSVSGDEYKAKARGIRQSLKSTEDLQQIVSNAKTDIIYKNVAGESLPDRFMYIIMTFMSGETLYLKGYADLLYAYNDGVNAFSTILNYITGFDDAKKQMDFTDFLTKIAAQDDNKQDCFKDGYNVDYVKNLIATAKDTATKVKSALSLLLNGDPTAIPPKLKLADMIKKLQDELSKHPDPQDEVHKAYVQILSVLQPLSGNAPDGTPILQVMINKVQAYYDYINSFTITTNEPVDPKQKDPTKQYYMYIKVGGVEIKMGDLIAYVNRAAGGDPSIPYPSLKELFSLMNTQLNAFSNLTQTQQIKLQMEMTKTNQEWSMVASCFSILIQMYFTLARSIAH